MAGTQPVVGAMVVSHASGVDRGVNTDAQGSFEFNLVVEDEVSFEVVGFEVRSGATMTVSANGRVHVIEVAGAAVISGRVVRGSEAVGGATITVDERAAATTGPAGTFEIGPLSAGPHTLRAEASALWARSQLVTVTLGADERKSGLELSLDSEAWIAGLVVDQDGAPVVGAIVTWICVGCSDGGHAITAGDGRYRVPHLRGGAEYRVTVVAGANVPFRPVAGNFPVLRLERGSRIDDVRLVVDSRVGCIRGRLLDAGGTPIPNTSIGVTLPGERRRGPFAWVTSGGDGRFQLRDLTAGTYQLLLGDEARLGVLPGVPASCEDTDFRAPSKGALRGIVEGFRDDGIRISLFRSFSTPIQAEAVTKDRMFRFENLPEGVYWIIARGSEQTGLQRAEVSASGEVTATVRSNRARVMVVATGGVRSICTCSISVRPPEGIIYLQTVTVEPDKAAEMSVPEGIELEVQCDSADFHGAARVPALAEGNAARVSVTLAPTIGPATR